MPIPLGLEVRGQRVALSAGHAHGVLVEDVGPVRRAMWRDDAGHPGEQLVIAIGNPLPRGGPAVEMVELHGQDGRLDRIEAGVDPHHVVNVLRLGAVDAKEADLLGHVVAVRRDHAGIAVGAEVLRRVEAETADGADGTGAGAGFVESLESIGFAEFVEFIGFVGSGRRETVLRADGLRGVFDHGEVVLGCEGHDFVHVSHLAVEVDGDDRLERQVRGAGCAVR